MPVNLPTVGPYAFKNCSSLTSIDIPENVTTVGYDAFIGCTSLTSITIHPTTPPTATTKDLQEGQKFGAFDNTNNAPIYVPVESVEAYKTANGWSEYADRIQAIP